MIRSGTRFIITLRAIPKPVYNNVQYPWIEYGNKLAIKQGGTTLIIGIKEKTANVLECSITWVNFGIAGIFCV